MTSDDTKKIKLRSSQLIKLNEHRKKIEKIILNQIDLDKINKTYRIHKKAKRIIKKLNDDKLSNELELISNLINI